MYVYMYTCIHAYVLHTLVHTHAYMQQNAFPRHISDSMLPAAETNGKLHTHIHTCVVAYRYAYIHTQVPRGLLPAVEIDGKLMTESVKIMQVFALYVFAAFLYIMHG